MTIVVLSVDEAHHLEPCLAAAAGQGELLVIDNACTDATQDIATRHGATIVRLDQRVSYAAAINHGLAEVRTDLVLLLNADCVVARDFIDRAAARFEPGVGSVQGLLVRADDGRVDAAGMWIDRRRKNGLVGHGDPVADHQASKEVFGPDGACALWRREALGAFDEDMALWVTDADVAWRARNQGWRCVFEPSARATHIRTYSPQKRSRSSEEHRRIQFRNRYLLMVRNETLGSLARNLPHILLYEVLALGHVILRERFLARGYLEAARLAPRVWRKR